MEYKKITEVEMIEEPSEGATVLAEDNGKLHRVPYKNVVGGGGIPMAIIKSSDYDDYLANMQSGVAPAVSAPETTYECINMTFDEAYEIMASGQLLQVMTMFAGDGATCGVGFVTLMPINNIMCIIIDAYELLFWTADGLSTSEPGGEVSPS